MTTDINVKSYQKMLFSIYLMRNWQKNIYFHAPGILVANKLFTQNDSLAVNQLMIYLKIKN